MRLFLSSFGLSNDPAALSHLVGSSRRAAVIVNALDNFPGARSEWLVQQTKALADLGFDGVELDLRKFFSGGDALAQFLADVGLVWISGGNAFILRRAMRQSGFDDQIKLLLSRNQIVYAGFSAAVVVAGPTLRGFELVDDPFDAPPPYETEIVWDGLCLIPNAVAVHFEAKDAQGEAMNGVIDRLAAAETPYITLPDGHALVIDGSLQTVVGEDQTARP